MKMTKVKEATECFSGNCNCCQSIIMTYGPQFGLEKELSIRMGTGFAGGIARHGEVCGAVSGSIMIIGLAHGMNDENDIEAREKTYELVNEFIKRFLEKNCFIDCNELLGCDLRTPEGRAFAKDQGLFDTLCPNFVKEAAEILEDLVL
jgi:C_GCAxxG_C_C family probable redox protein